MLTAQQNDRILRESEPPLVFLDIDNTLAARASKEASDANFAGLCAMPTQRVMDALAKAAEKGTMLFICTGRPTPGIVPELLELPVAGYVSCAGAVACYGGEILRDVSLSADEVRRVCEPVIADGRWVFCEGPDMIACVGRGAISDEVVRSFETLDGLERACPSMHFGKIVVNDEGAKIMRANPETIEGFTLLYTGGGVNELTLPSITKAHGVRAILDRVGPRRGKTYGFGDSENDSSLFDAVEVKVAMGNATEGLMSRADVVTDSVFDDGAATGLERLGLA